MSKKAFYLVAGDPSTTTGPQLKDYQIDALQEKLGAEVEVRGIGYDEFKKLSLTREEIAGVWLYYRGKPVTEAENVKPLIPEGVFVINDYKEIDCGDKLEVHLRAEHAGITAPLTFSIGNMEDLDSTDLQYPLVIKGYPSGQGKDVHLCAKREDAENAINASLTKGLGILAQEYIAESHGKDLRVIIINGKIISCLKRQAGDNGFLSNISTGGHYEEINLTEEQRKVIEETVRAFPEVDIAGIDFLFGKDGLLLFTEINSAVGWNSEKSAEAIVPILAEMILTRARINLVNS